MSIHYQLRIASTATHCFAVRLTVPADIAAKGATLTLPAWIPGSYMIRDFARHILSIGGEDNNGPVALTKRDKQTWQAAAADGPLIIEYEVYAWDLSVRGAHLDNTHGYGNGAALFLRVVGAEHVSCEVEFLRPEGEAFRDWRLAVSMRSVNAPEWGFGTYQADGYDDLIDHPFEMGQFELLSFDVQGVPHHMVFTGRYRADMDRIAHDVQLICTKHAEMFGELPVDRYLFLVMVTKDGYGGLEHRYSTSLICPRDDLPVSGMAKVSDGYRRFLGLCSHEYFHLWNVKRIRPQVLAEADLSIEVHTEALWAFEGITSYYDELGLVRSGTVPLDSYLDGLAQTIARVQSGSGRQLQSVAASSFDAWTRFYKQDENAPNAIVSYYTKGSLIVLALDLGMRLRSNGRKSMDDVMRALWQRHGKPGIPVPERGIEALISDVAGADFSEFFERFLYGTEDPALTEVFAEFGIDMQLHPGDDKKANPNLSLGVRLDKKQTAAMLAQVLTGGAAQQAGLSAGDELLALDGIRLDRTSLPTILARYAPDDEAELHYFRRDELHRTQITMQKPVECHCTLTAMDNADRSIVDRRAAWLALPSLLESVSKAS